MEYVIDAIALKVIEVPDDYIECSVCHKWMPKASYCDEHGVQVRTNCKEYALASEDRTEVKIVLNVSQARKLINMKRRNEQYEY